ncbi:MAG: S-layer family protein, partial [Bdellovibrionales bacterium]|nr:hypothetical protein [Bdellovibrionales bacterium]NQZ19294.1 S-layer family protein [Bdellovibrionales bacterium]
SRTWGGFVSELIIFNRALNATEVEDVENYLMLKWGISAADTTWTGASNTDWFTPGNWSNGVPNASTGCIIPDVANDPIINGTAICQNVNITTGNVTIQNATGSSLQAYGNFSNSGTITYNDGQLVIVDDGLSNTNQIISSTTAIENLSFNKTAGGQVQISGASLTVNNFSMPSGSFFNFIVDNGVTLNLTSGMTMAAGTFDVDGGGTVNITGGQSISVTGGTFQVSGTNDVYPQNTSNKGTITSAGRWGFNASAGSVSLTGFILNNLDVSGLQITGTADLAAFDGGQFTNLLNDFATPVRALVLNTSTSITESLSSNIGFSWTTANATYSGAATSADNYFLVHANNCNNSVLVFDQWFGDFWGVAPQPTIEDKIFDDGDGGSCQVSMDVSASPVHLLSFIATPYDQEVSLDWETGSELNHLGFNVYRSDSMYGNYQQINQEMIQNFVNTTSFKGNYRYVDSGLTMGLYGSAPADSGENVVNDGNDDSATNVIAVEPEIITETLTGLRLRVSPSALTLTDAAWNSSYKEISIPGYSRTLEAGDPELIHRRFLLEVAEAYSSVSASQISLSYNSYTAALAGNSITPAPEWNLNPTTQQLEAIYSPEASRYALNEWLPGQVYNVSPATAMINGRHYVQIDFWPVRYNPALAQLEEVNEIVLELSLDGATWNQPTLQSSVIYEPAAVENNLRIEFNQTGVYEISFDDLVSANLEGPFGGANTNDLRLYKEGLEIPLEIESVDSVFNSGDSIRFFATYESALDSNNDQVVLSLSDLRKESDIDPEFDFALRINSVENGYSQQPIENQDYHWKSNFNEQDLYAVFDVPLGSQVDHIYWKRIFTEGGSGLTGNSHHDFSVVLDDIHLNNDENVKVTVDLRGRGVFAKNPKHHMRLSINSVDRAEVEFTGNENQQVVFEVPSYFFVYGSNNIRLTSLATFVNSGDFDLIDINSVNIEYPAEFKALNDVAHITSRQPNEQIVVKNFNVTNLKIYDVSDRYDSMIYQTFSIDSHSGS